MLMKELGVQMNGIPYRGTGPAMNDLLSNQFDLMCDQTTNTTNQIKEGKIKGFAVTTKAKVSSLPDLPTLDSGAVKGFEASAWHAMWAPKGLPKDATDKLVAALQAALKDPKVIERFASLGTEPVAGGTGDTGGAQGASDRRSAALGRRHQGRRGQGKLNARQPPHHLQPTRDHSRSGDFS